MIARWMIIGFVLWAAVTLAFRFLEPAVFSQGVAGVPLLLVVVPVVMFIVTFLLLRILKVDPSDRGEVASIFALPGLLVGIYTINSFHIVFPNLDASLYATFASFMYASYAATILAGVISSRMGAKA